MQFYFFSSTDQKTTMTKISITQTWRTRKMRQLEWMQIQRQHYHRLSHTAIWRGHHTKIQNINAKLLETFVKDSWCLPHRHQQPMDKGHSQNQVQWRRREAIQWFTTTHGHIQVRWVINFYDVRFFFLIFAYLIKLKIDITTEACQTVSKTIHVVCSISVAIYKHIFDSKLSHFGATISLNAIVIVIASINHETLT